MEEGEEGKRERGTTLLKRILRKRGSTVISS